MNVSEKTLEIKEKAHNFCVKHWKELTVVGACGLCFVAGMRYCTKHDTGTGTRYFLVETLEDGNYQILDRLRFARPKLLMNSKGRVIGGKFTKAEYNDLMAYFLSFVPANEIDDILNLVNTK